MTLDTTLLAATTMTTTVVVGIVGWCWMLHRRQQQQQQQQSSTKDKASTFRVIPPTSNNKNNKKKKTPVLKNVWETPGINVTSSRSLPTDSDDEDDEDNDTDTNTNNNNTTQKTHKFSSSYYYAHNNPKAIGGYKDGLRLEDYTMNQPRLLSVTSRRPSGSTDDDTPMTTMTTTTTITAPTPDENHNNNNNNTNTNIKKKKQKPIRTIAHYLWDDPGDPIKGVATLRIDSFPHWKDSSQRVPYKDIQVLHVQADLVVVNKDKEEKSQSQPQPLPQQGLKIKVEAEEALYELYLPALYGPVSNVKTIVKSHKLLIKLTKMKTSTTSTSNQDKNLKAWPEPGRKVVAL